MKNIKTTQLLFIAGLIIYIVGQILLAQGTDFVRSLKPVDFAHWCLYIGVVLCIPQSVSFGKNIAAYIGTPMTILGISFIIGMCIIDFILWSFESIEERSEFINYLSKVDVIWIPFIAIGPGFFNLGLAIQSLNYRKKNLAGTLAVILGTIIIFGVIPFNHSIIYGYIVFTIGFAMIFFRRRSQKL